MLYKNSDSQARLPENQNQLFSDRVQESAFLKISQGFLMCSQAVGVLVLTAGTGKGGGRQMEECLSDTPRYNFKDILLETHYLSGLFYAKGPLVLFVRIL